MSTSHCDLTKRGYIAKAAIIALLAGLWLVTYAVPAVGSGAAGPKSRAGTPAKRPAARVTPAPRTAGRPQHGPFIFDVEPSNSEASRPTPRPATPLPTPMAGDSGPAATVVSAYAAGFCDYLVVCAGSSEDPMGQTYSLYRLRQTDYSNNKSWEVFKPDLSSTIFDLGDAVRDAWFFNLASTPFGESEWVKLHIQNPWAGGVDMMKSVASLADSPGWERVKQPDRLVANIDGDQVSYDNKALERLKKNEVNTPTPTFAQLEDGGFDPGELKYLIDSAYDAAGIGSSHRAFGERRNKLEEGAGLRFKDSPIRLDPTYSDPEVVSCFTYCGRRYAAINYSLNKTYSYADGSQLRDGEQYLSSLFKLDNDLLGASVFAEYEPEWDIDISDAWVPDPFLVINRFRIDPPGLKSHHFGTLVWKPVEFDEPLYTYDVGRVNFDEQQFDRLEQGELMAPQDLSDETLYDDYFEPGELRRALEGSEIAETFMIP